MLINDPPVAITENLLMLGTTPYQVYLFKGEHEAVVFDGGIGPVGPLVSEQLETLGIDRRLVKQVVITHAHPDHVMAVPGFREMFPEVTVAASEPAAATLSNEKAIGFFTKVDAALTAALTKAGTITEEYHPKPLDQMAIPVDRIIKQGDQIAVDGVSFDVLETPGHSDCSLSFFEPTGKILIIADATGYYVPDQHYWWPNYFTGYGAYLGSIERLAALDAEVLCLCHNAVITGAEEITSYFDDAIAATKACHEQILADRESGKSVREIAERIGTEVYEKTPLMPVEFFQKNSGLLVKQSLRFAGVDEG